MQRKRCSADGWRIGQTESATTAPRRKHFYLGNRPWHIIAPAGVQLFLPMKSNELRLRIVIVLAAWWVIAMPPIWAQALSSHFEQNFRQLISFYMPELAIAAACLILLPAAWLRRRWAMAGLVAAAFLFPLLKGWLGSPSSGAWIVSSALLLLVAWGSGARNIEPPSDVAEGVTE